MGARRRRKRAGARDLLDRYLEATEAADVDRLTEVLREDLRFSMPPEPGVYEGRDEVVSGWISGGFGTEEEIVEHRTVTYANRQLGGGERPTRRPGEAEHRLFAVDVLRRRAGGGGSPPWRCPRALDLPQTL